MPNPIYLPPPQDPFASILPFAMQLYAMKQRKDLADQELKGREEAGKSNLYTSGFEPIPNEELEHTGPQGTKLYNQYWRKSPVPGGNMTVAEIDGQKVIITKNSKGDLGVHPISRDNELSPDMATLYGPNNETKRVAIPKSGEYTPPAGWSLKAPNKETILQPTSTQLKTRNWTDEKGVKWEQDFVFDPKTQDLRPKGEPVKVGTDTTVMQRIKEADVTRREFQGLADVKQYQDVDYRMKVMEESIQESKQTKNFVATDQALITTFNKMTDPNSVVRESEYARTKDDLSFLHRMKGKIEKIGQGGPGLTQDDRQHLYQLAKRFHNAAQKKYEGRVKEYRGYLTNIGVDPEKYLSPPEAGGQVDYIWDGTKLVPAR